MIVYGVDPGYTQSGLVLWDGERILRHAILPNEELLAFFRAWPAAPTDEGSAVLVIEQVESYGMGVGKEVFETVYWSGKFAEAFAPYPVERLGRKAIKLHICQSHKADDAAIRRALIDRFGPTKEVAIGTKAAPGPLYGIKSHLYSALAVALTYYDQKVAGEAWG